MHFSGCLEAVGKRGKVKSVELYLYDSLVHLSIISPGAALMRTAAFECIYIYIYICNEMKWRGMMSGVFTRTQGVGSGLKGKNK